MKVSGILLVTLASTVCTVASAQDYIGTFSSANTAGINIAGTIAVNAAIEKQAQNASKKRAGRSTATASAATAGSGSALAASRLTFTPKASVSRRVKDEFRIAVQRANPDKAAHIAQVLEQHDVMADFDRDMAPYGLNSTNIADAMTAYWITMWIIATDSPAPKQREIDGIRNQVTANMLDNQMVRDATDTERQEMTEGLIYETMVALGMLNNAHDTGNQKEIRVMSDNAQRNMLKQGVDMRALRLTRNGFTGG